MITKLLILFFLVSCSSIQETIPETKSTQVIAKKTDYILYGDIYLPRENNCEQTRSSLGKISCLVMNHQFNLAEKLAFENSTIQGIELYLQILRANGKWNILAQKINQLNSSFVGDYLKVLYYFDTNQITSAVNSLNNLKNYHQETDLIRGLSLVLSAEQKTGQQVSLEFSKLANNVKSMPFINTYLEKYFRTQNNQEGIRQILAYRNSNTQNFEIEL